MKNRTGYLEKIRGLYFGVFSEANEVVWKSLSEYFPTPADPSFQRNGDKNKFSLVVSVFSHSLSE